MRGLGYSKLQWGLIFLPIVVITAWFGMNMHVLGYRFWSQPEIELDYVMGVLWWCVFALGILAFAGDSRRMLLLAWVGKFFVVLVVMLFYEYYYGLDAVGYHRAAMTGYINNYFPGYDFYSDMIPSFTPIPMEAHAGIRRGLGTENAIRFSLLIASVTGPFYHAMKVACAFLGLLGVWGFYRAVVIALGRPYPPAFYLLAFFPSIIFWSSILGKDPWMFFFLGIYAYGGALWLVQGRPAALWWVGLGLSGAFMLRSWMCVVGGAALFLSTLLGRRRRGWQVVLVLVVGLPVFWIIEQNAVWHFEEVLQETLIESVSGMAQGFAQKATGGGQDIDFSSSEGVTDNIPLAMFSGLFRPLPFDITNAFTALAAAENTFVLLLALAALRRFRFVFLWDPIVLWLLLFTLMWTSLYGFIVLVNFGSGVRYKLQVWPFFLMLLVTLVHPEGRAWLKSRIPRMGSLGRQE